MFWRKIINYGESIGIGGVILYLSLFRTISLDAPLFEGADKLVHFMLYYLLGAALAIDLYRAQVPIKKLFIIAISVATFYGGVIELLQEYYFPPRTGDWLDWIADIAGAIIGVVLVWMTKKSSSTR